MKAVIYTKYGSPDVLQLKEVEKPAPRDNEVLVKVHATTVTIGDTIMRSFKLPVSGWQKLMARLILGMRKPKRPILGMELAGEIEAIGKECDTLQDRRSGFCIHAGREFWRLCRVQVLA